MIKISAIASAHAIHILLRNTLIAIVILLLALFIWLKAGIKIDTLHISGYHIGGLYIKLDKKLTLKAQYLVLPHRKSSPTVNNVDETLEKVKYILEFFKTIELNNITFENNALTIVFHDDYLKITSKDYTILGTVHRKGKMLSADVPLLHLNEHNITLAGSFTYDLENDILKTKGKFLFFDTKGTFAASKSVNKIQFSLKSDTSNDIRPIIEKFNLNKTVRSWIIDKVQAREYKLIFFEGQGDIYHGKFKLDTDSLRGMADLSDVKIYFQKNLQPVHAETVLLTYEDGGLYFRLYKPVYRGKDLAGSSVSIVDLTDANTTLKLDIHIETPFDKTVRHLLKSYDLKIPVLQTSGTAKSVFRADIGLKNKKMSFWVDSNIIDGNVSIQKVGLPVKKGEVHYGNGSIKFDNVLLKSEMYEGILNGTLDLEKKEADLVFDADSIDLTFKDAQIAKVKNEHIPFTMQYKKDLQIEIPQWDIFFKSSDENTELHCKDLSKVVPYLSNQMPKIEGGDITFKTKDFETFFLNGILKRNSCFLYENNDTCKVRVDIDGTITPKDFKLYAFDKKFFYQKSKSRITLNSLNIDLKKFLEREETSQSSIKDEKKKKEKSKNSLVILGKNSHLRYDEYSLITDSYDVEVKSNGDIKAIGSTEGDIIKFTKEDSILLLQALRVKDKVLHPLINFSGLQNGRYSITKTGDPSEVMKGEIIVEGGVMKDFKAYNNTLAFINTIPALATLHQPGYSNEGFMIDSGVIEYRMIKRDKIIFDSIYIKGKSATIVGKGELDLNEKTMNIQLGIQVGRTLAKVVGNIPIVGYILVGEDKSLTVGLEVTGSLDKPKVNVSATKDILSYPLDIIKRTLEAPTHMINEPKESQQ